MKNWSRHIEWHPNKISFPKSEEEVQTLVIKAANDNLRIRIIGSGHSFNPLWVTDSILISLDQYQGLISVDKESGVVCVKGGTKLNVLGELLASNGLAMENLGDIDAQSIAGTISTGTHGTGMAFGTISTQVIAVKFVNGNGRVVECSENKNLSLFKSAQLSLGLFGIITEVTLQCVPAYKLKLSNKQERLDEVIATMNERVRDNRNFEFFCFPYSKKVWTKASNTTEEPAKKPSAMNYLSEYVLENYLFKVLCETARFLPSLNRSVSQLSAGSIPNMEKVHQSHKVYATKRLVRFNEMEYNVPIEAHETVLKEIMQLIEKKKFNIHFPIENRVVRKDDIHISPAYQRDSAYIACHVYNKKNFHPFFKAAEEVFKSFDGRPHWGKMHFWTKVDVDENYPMIETFRRHRTEHDPDGIFLNDYLKNLFV